MDQIYKYNNKRWNDLAHANALFSRPWLDLDPIKAKERLGNLELAGDLKDKKVLCLASGGGQQSIAFALLGAKVTVFDISEEQLKIDIEAAKHYCLEVKTTQGDMRDLSAFKDNSFDIVWQPYSINFVPDCKVVFDEVSRVLKTYGVYHFACANPFAAGMGTKNWTGNGYLIDRPYKSGEKITYSDEILKKKKNYERAKPILFCCFS